MTELLSNTMPHCLYYNIFLFVCAILFVDSKSSSNHGQSKYSICVQRASVQLLASMKE